jgi:hypothetical protein
MSDWGIIIKYCDTDDVRAMSDAIGCKFEVIRKFRSGSNISLTTAKKLATAFGFDYKEFFKEIIDGRD